jgi:hypothetical protein
MQRITLFNSLIVAALLLSACAAPTGTPVATATVAPLAATLPATSTDLPATAVPTALPPTAAPTALPATATATALPMTATPEPPSPTATATAVGSSACPGAPNSQLKTGSWSIANPELKVSLNLRARPAQAAASLGLVLAGEWVKIVDGPQCADGLTWWKVQTAKNNLTGWMAEGDPAGYWLVPLPTPTPTPNATTTMEAIRKGATATVEAGRAMATGLWQTATAARQTAAAGQTATARAAPTQTAQAVSLATAARATYVSNLTAQAQATQSAATQRAARDRATLEAAQAQQLAAAQTKTALEAQYTYVQNYTVITSKVGNKIRFRAYVASIKGQTVRVYTSTPDRAVVVDLRPGFDPAGLKISSTVAYTFYGETKGLMDFCDNLGCAVLPWVSEAAWTP